MLYVLLIDRDLQLITVDHTEAQAAFRDAAEHADPDMSIRLLQTQADVIQERIPTPIKPVSNAPLTDAEKRQLSELLARHGAVAQKEGA